MAFPVPGTPVASATDTPATSHVVDLPTPVAGEVHYALLSFNSNRVVTSPVTDPWVELDSNNGSPGTAAVFARVMDGTEATSATFTTDGANVAGAFVVVAVAVTTEALVAGTDFDIAFTAAATATTADPPNVTATWGPEDNLYLAMATARGDNATISTYPGSYINGTDSASTNGGGGGASAALATRELAASSDNPGVFTWSESELVMAYTVVVRPASGLTVEVNDAGVASDAVSTDLTRSSATGSPLAGVVPAGVVSTTSVAVPVPADVQILVDFDRDGDFDDPLETITPKVLSLSTSLGRDYASQLRGRITAGRLRVTVRNFDDLFTAYNDSSPLIVPPFSLEPGARIVLQETGTADGAPVPVVRDLFEGSGAIADAETGQTWGAQFAGYVPTRSGGFLTVDGSPDSIGGAPTIDTGLADYYLQATWDHLDGSNVYAIRYRIAGPDDYGEVELAAGVLTHRVVVAGTPTDLPLANVERRQGLTFGALVEGGIVFVYLDGVLLAGDLAAGSTESTVGLFGQMNLHRPVRCEEFHAWPAMRTSPPGSIWSGWVASIVPAVAADGRKTATIEAYGDYARLAGIETTAPTSVGVTPQSVGTFSGYLIGDVLRRSKLLHPPAAATFLRGVDRLGAVGLDDAQAETHIRKLVETEAGLLWEDEGGTFRHLDGANVSGGGTPAASPVASWGDLGQFQFETVEVLDWSREIVNEIRPRPSPIVPNLVQIASLFDSTAAGVQRPVSVVFPSAPTAAAGDLVVCVVVSTVFTDGEQWLNPPGLASLRNVGSDPYRARFYAKVLTFDDLGQQEEIYADAGIAGGAFYSRTFLFKDWSGDLQGVAVNANGVGAPNALGPARSGDNDPPLIFWERVPSLFVAGRTGAVASTAAGSVDTSPPDAGAPFGFFNNAAAYLAGSGSTSFDVASQYAIREGVLALIDPTPFGTDFRHFDYVDAFTIAVAGFEPDPVTVSELVSQRARQAIRTYPEPGQLFDSEATAIDYGVGRVSRFAKARPLLRVTFSAARSAAFRAQANGTRVQDKIRCTFDGSSRSGLVYTGDFIVESVERTITDAGKQHRVAWQLSPADPPAGEQQIVVS